MFEKTITICTKKIRRSECKGPPPFQSSVEAAWLRWLRIVWSGSTWSWNCVGIYHLQISVLNILSAVWECFQF